MDYTDEHLASFGSYLLWHLPAVAIITGLIIFVVIPLLVAWEANRRE